MYILSQDRTKIVNVNQIAAIDVLSGGEIYASQYIDPNLESYALLGKYDDAKSALDDILIALKNGSNIYEMPESV